MTDIVFCAKGGDAGVWVRELAALMPQARVQAFASGEPGNDGAAADYAVVWTPAAELFERHTRLKAIFNLGAGVDALLAMPNLPKNVSVVRLGDAGMSVQMAEYVTHAVIRFTRELDRYENDTRELHWRLRKPTLRRDFPIAVLGLGVIGARVAQSLAGFEFPVFGWSRNARSIAGIECLHGEGGLDRALAQSRIVVCILPLTPDTDSILCRRNLEKLLPGGLVINVARGAHLVDEDLLALLDSGHLARAVLDVFREEPLPAEHPFWKHPAIVMTPHISARTLRAATLEQISEKIRRLEQGLPIEGIVDRMQGY
jgi:glyoxylate/hydroxypyruvate reductase A